MRLLCSALVQAEEEVRLGDLQLAPVVAPGEEDIGFTVGALIANQRGIGERVIGMGMGEWHGGGLVPRLKGPLIYPAKKLGNEAAILTSRVEPHTAP